MAEVRIYPHNFNPHNPRRAKPWTADQAAARKDQAERYLRDVIEDDDRADEIAEMSPEEYAEERGKKVIENPRRRNVMKRKSIPAAQNTSAALRSNRVNPEVLISELQSENAELRKQLELDKLQSENSRLRKQLSEANRKLDEVDEILGDDDPNYSESDQLDDIQEVIDGKGSGGTGKSDDYN